MLPASIDDDQLRVFVAFADHGGFTAAAAVIHRSQPAVHAQIQKLQDDLGVRLYTRVGRGVRLTPAGAVVAAFGRRHLADTAALRARLSGDRTERVVLATGAGVLRDLLAPGVARFVQDGGRVDVRTGDRTEVVGAVRDGRARVGVTAAGEPPPGIWARALCSVGLALAVPIAWPACQGPLPLGVLAQHPLILPPQGGPVRAALDTALGATPLQVVATCKGWDAALALVAAGAGVALVNDSCQVPPTVRLVDLDTRALPRTHYWLLARPGGPRGAAKHLVELLSSTVRSLPEPPDGVGSAPHQSP